MFNFLGRLTAAHAWTICAVWLVAGAALTLVAPAWDATTQDDDIRFLPDRCASVRGYHLLEKAFPEDVCASRAIFAVERPGGRLTDADFTLVNQCVADLDQLRRQEPALKIGKVGSYRDPLVGRRLTSVDGRCTLIQVALATPFLALLDRKSVV